MSLFVSTPSSFETNALRSPQDEGYFAIAGSALILRRPKPVSKDEGVLTGVKA